MTGDIYIFFFFWKWAHWWRHRHRLDRFRFKNFQRPGWTRDLLVSSRTVHPTEPPRPTPLLFNKSILQPTGQVEVLKPRQAIRLLSGWSVYVDRLSPLNNQYLCTFFCQKLITAFLNQRKRKKGHRKYFMINPQQMLRDLVGISSMHPTEPLRLSFYYLWFCLKLLDE